MTAKIVGIRTSQKGTIVYLNQKMTEIEGVSSGYCTLCSWLGLNENPFVVGEEVYIGRPFKGWVEISKLRKD